MNDDSPRFVNEVHHECGCVTRFDTLYWRSVIVHPPCAFHQSVIERGER